MNNNYSFDERRDLATVPGSKENAIDFCVYQFVLAMKTSFEKHGSFSVALSGGSTPKAIYQKIAAHPQIKKLPWEKVFLFWSDERCVAQSDSESNYKMAMDAGLASLPIPEKQIFPMYDKGDPKKAAQHYEELLKKHLPHGSLDLTMLGMGEDGHTASLFPHTEALQEEKALAVANHIPDKDCWRITLTYPCINASKHTAIYVFGKNKETTVAKVLKGPYQPKTYPIQKIGTEKHKAFWILDQDAAAQLS